MLLVCPLLCPLHSSRLLDAVRPHPHPHPHPTLTVFTDQGQKLSVILKFKPTWQKKNKKHNVGPKVILQNTLNFHRSWPVSGEMLGFLPIYGYHVVFIEFSCTIINWKKVARPTGQRSLLTSHASHNEPWRITSVSVLVIEQWRLGRQTFDLCATTALYCQRGRWGDTMSLVNWLLKLSAADNRHRCIISVSYMESWNKTFFEVSSYVMLWSDVYLLVQRT